MITRAGLPEVGHVNTCIGRDFPGIDFAEILSEPLHICLMEGEGGAVFLFRGPGIYEVHVFFDCGGREVIDLSHRMLAVMRDQYGARLFWALVPIDSRKVKIFTRWMGWLSQGVLMTKNGPNELFVSENIQCLLR